ncbi:MAG TPA: hypothetical protein VH502_13615 [Actinoplanes sp.]
MTSQPQPTPGSASQYLRPLRDIAAYALVAAPAAMLFVAIIRLIPSGVGLDFGSRAQDSFYSYVNVPTIFFPLGAVLLALVVRPPHPKAKLITIIALVEYAVAAVFAIVFGILVGLIKIAGFSVRTAFEELLVRVAWLAVFAVAAFAVYQIWRHLFYTPKPKPQPGVYGQPQYGVPGTYPGQPGYGQPGAAQPGAGVGQPGAGVGQPGAGVGQPGVGQQGVGVGQPGVAQPGGGAGQPGVGQPGFGQPGGHTGVPSAAEAPAYGQPGVGQPGYGQSGYGQPPYGSPGYGQPYGTPGAYPGQAAPAATQPVAPQPVSTQPLPGQPTTGAPAGTYPGEPGYSAFTEPTQVVPQAGAEVDRTQIMGDDRPADDDPRRP